MQHINRGNKVYDIGGTISGKPKVSEVLLRMPISRKIKFLENMIKSRMNSGIAANAEAVFSLKKDTVEFATITFGAGESVATFACASLTLFSEGEELTLVAPGSQDANLEGIGWILVAERI